MFRVEKISSLDAPELQPYATMRRPLEHERLGIFVAEGDKVVRRLLKSRFGVVSLLVTEKWLAEYAPLLAARAEKEIPVFIAEKNLFEQLTGNHIYQGVLAVGKIPAPDSLEKILANAPRPRLFVAVDEVGDAENLGALVRNCAAFGAQALIVGETGSSPFLRRAVRNSMGAIFQLPVIELKQKRGPHESENELRGRGISTAGKIPTLAEILRDLRSHGVRCLAAHPRADSQKLSQTDFSGDCCIVFGSEGKGISQTVLEACDAAIAIPMPPTVDSLNVGAAAAVFLYEVARQRERA